MRLVDNSAGMKELNFPLKQNVHSPRRRSTTALEAGVQTAVHAKIHSLQTKYIYIHFGVKKMLIAAMKILKWY